MNVAAPWLFWIAGGLHLLIASANLFAVRMFHYRQNMQQVSAVVREVFWVQNVFLELTLAGFAMLCFAFSGDLAGGSQMGQCCSGFLALFWGLRLVLQLFYYDQEVRRRYRALDVLFVLAQVYLTGLFTLAATGQG
ncbi:MAG: hypothetical protein AB7O62_13410 [Pirellulales bacterium]